TIWTISSRASPLPPGNWCDALSTVCAWPAADNAQRLAAAASAAANFLIGLLLYRVSCFSMSPRNAILRALSKPRSTRPTAMTAIELEQPDGDVPRANGCRSNDATLDLAVATSKHLREELTRACSVLGGVHDSARADRTGSAARGCRHGCASQRYVLAAAPDPPDRPLPRWGQHRRHCARFRAEARPGPRPADRDREPRRGQRQYRRRRGRQGAA